MTTSKLIAAALVAAGALAVPAQADEPGPDWISIGRVERLLGQEGYRLIEIEAKDDHWEGEATRHGRTWDIRISPAGGIISIEPDSD